VQVFFRRKKIPTIVNRVGGEQNTRFEMLDPELNWAVRLQTPSGSGILVVVLRQKLGR
jgi:hypothetical protein